MAHVLGQFFKYLAAALVIGFSASLGYQFFSSIAPPNIPWFIPAAMGLTEGGLLCWLAVFMLTVHQDIKKVIALVMVFACLVAVAVTDAVELANLFQVAFVITRTTVYVVLILMLIGHLLAFIADFFVSYFSRYAFRGNKNSLAVVATQLAQEGHIEITEANGNNNPITGEVQAFFDPLVQRLPLGRQKKGIKIPGVDANIAEPSTLNSLNTSNEPAKGPGSTSGK